MMKLLQKYMVILLIILFGSCSVFKKQSSIKLKKLSHVKNFFIPKVLWKKQIGHGIDNFYSNLHPNYYNGVIFTADRFGIVKALNANNGKEIWNINLAKDEYSFFKKRFNSALLSGGITVDKNLIFIGSENGILYAINNINGKIIWKNKIIGEILSSPKIYKNNIFIRTGNGILQCFDKRNGITKWNIHLSILDKLSIRGQSSPYVDSNRVIIGDDNGLISAINIQNGKIIWQKSIIQFNNHVKLNNIHDIDITPIVLNNKIYVVSYNGYLTCLNLQFGNTLWKKKIGSIKNIILYKNFIYIVDQTNRIASININNHKIIWIQNNLLKHKLTSPIIYNNYLIVGDDKGYLYFININNGKFINKQKIDNSGFQTDFLVVKNRLFIQSKIGMIYAITENHS